MKCPDCGREMDVIKTDSGGAYLCTYCQAKWKKAKEIGHTKVVQNRQT